MLTARDNQRATTEAAAQALAVGAEALTTDGATLQSGGWELQAARAPVGQLLQPANFVATGGDLEGTVDLPVNLNVGQRVSPARVSAGNPLGRRDALPYVDASPVQGLRARFARPGNALSIRGNSWPKVGCGVCQ